MSALELTLIPRISEKTFGLSQDRVYTFNVPMTANKQQIMAAVAAQYNVKVEDARMVIVKGKVVRTAKKRSQPIVGKRNDVKKAYVRLAEGNSIKMFEEETK